MEKLEIRMQEELFDVETQYCDPDDCYHDCKLNVPKVFLPGESEEKYQNMKNDYGKRMRFNFVTITPEDIPAFPGSQVGDIYTDIQTPEIDYASITKYEDMLIAGVPALYRISNGKITEFYFDSVEIEEFFNSIGRWDYGYKGNLKPYMVMDL